MRFEKGKSGNPGGRPKAPPEKVEVKELAQKYTTAAIEGLAAIATDETKDPRARVQAFNALLDRGHGKPTQPTLNQNVPYEGEEIVTIRRAGPAPAKATTES